jgi:UDP-N-acetylenolpyruvoylglucosamine reductase
MSGALVETSGRAIDALAAELAERLSAGSLIRRDEPLAKRTTLRVGGPADLFVAPADEADLGITLQCAARHGAPWKALGRGSNLLVRDGGYRGVVIFLGQGTFIRMEAEGESITCGAGVRLRDLANEARRLGLAGLEFLAGIPGSVGGALRMNAGAWGGMTFERLERVRFMTPEGTVQERAGGEIPASYRRCDLFRDHIALGAVFRGTPSTREAVEARMKELNEKRWSSQPAAPSAGCIFKNPPSIAAGRLVDELGLKGLRVGGAVVSEAHGNFIVNEGGATAADVLELIRRIRERAAEARGVELEVEVEVIGE